jgi:hypothetical protein
LIILTIDGRRLSAVVRLKMTINAICNRCCTEKYCHQSKMTKGGADWTNYLISLMGRSKGQKMAQHSFFLHNTQHRKPNQPNFDRHNAHLFPNPPQKPTIQTLHDHNSHICSALLYYFLLHSQPTVFFGLLVLCR